MYSVNSMSPKHRHQPRRRANSPAALPPTLLPLLLLTLALTLVLVGPAALTSAAPDSDTETDAVTYLEVLDDIRRDIAFYDSVDEAVWVMLDDPRLSLGFLRPHMSISSLQNRWPALDELHQNLYDFILFSTAVEVAAMDLENRFDPTLRERLETLASRTYTIASSPATGIAQVILEVSLDRFARGVYESVNQRFWTQYQAYQAEHSQSCYINAMESDGFAGIVALMDTFWEQEEVEYARQLRALEDAYPNARDAYRSQYLLDYLMAPPNPLLSQWMDERRQEASRAIITAFNKLVFEVQDTAVVVTGRVTERHLPDHPAQGRILVTPGDSVTNEVSVENGQYRWRGAIYRFWDPVEREWVPLKLDYERTHSAELDYSTPSIQIDLPTLATAGGITLTEGDFHVSMPVMSVINFAAVQLTTDDQFRLMGPRTAPNVPFESTIRPFGRYDLIVGEGQKPVVLNQAAHTFSPPDATGIPEPVVWTDPDPALFFGEDDPLEAFLEVQREVQAAMHARNQLISNHIGTLRDRLRAEDDPAREEALEEEIEALQAQREQQTDLLADSREGDTRFREALTAHNNEQQEAARQRGLVTRDILNLYTEMGRVIDRIAHSLRPIPQIGRSVVLWTGHYSRAMWNEDRFEQQAARDEQQLEDAFEQFEGHWQSLSEAREQQRQLLEQEYDEERLRQPPSNQTRDAMRRVQAYMTTAEKTDTRQAVEEAKDEVVRSIDSFRHLSLELADLLEALEDRVENQPPLPDEDAAKATAAQLQADLQAVVQNDDSAPLGRQLVSDADAAKAAYRDYLPAHVLQTPGWTADVQAIIQEIEGYRHNWGLHSEAINNQIREARQAMAERNLPSLTTALADVQLFVSYANQFPARAARLYELVETADNHVEALDDDLAYSQRMDAVLDAYEAASILPTHWQEPRLAPVLDSFQRLLADEDSLSVYARQRGLVYPVWTQIQLRHGQDPLVLELDDVVQFEISREHWDDAEAVLAYGRVVGQQYPVHLPMKLTYSGGHSVVNPRIPVAPDGTFLVPMGTTSHPNATVLQASPALARTHPFYQLLQEVPMVYWEEE